MREARRSFGRKRSLVLFAATALVASSGCIYVPYANVTFRGNDLGTDDRAPLRVGRVTRDEVFARFGGDPDYRTVHDRAVGYCFGEAVGWYAGLKFGPCMPYFGSSDVYATEHLWLEFDGAGTLARYERHTERDVVMHPEREWEAFTRTAPDDRWPGDAYGEKIRRRQLAAAASVVSSQPR